LHANWWQYANPKSQKFHTKEKTNGIDSVPKFILKTFTKTLSHFMTNQATCIPGTQERDHFSTKLSALIS